MPHFIRLLFVALSLSTASGTMAQVMEVRVTQVHDWRPVFGKVESVKQALARARLAGELHDLSADEGDQVSGGDVLALIVDDKLALEISAIEAGIRALIAEIDLARVDLERIKELRERGAAPMTALDQARTALTVARENHAAMLAKKAALLARQAEGAVKAPDAGRILSVPVVEGMYVNPGETVATIATDNFILRAKLPERHARYLKIGDTVRIVARGALTKTEVTDDGKIGKIYPELSAGQVVVDVEAAGLGDFFVGERVRLLVATGERDAIVVPPDYMQRRNGVTFARLENQTEIVIQPGVQADGGIEVLAGLNPGDRLLPYGKTPK